MDMNGEQLIPLPRQRVWEALNDPETLKACIPGCESIERVSDAEYKIAMTAAIGPVKAKFSGKLLLSDLNPPESYTIAFEGSGGAAGFGKGGAKVVLAPEGDSTRLVYTAHATVGGKLAQIGSRLIDGVAKKMTEDFSRSSIRSSRRLRRKRHLPLGKQRPRQERPCPPGPGSSSPSSSRWRCSSSGADRYGVGTTTSIRPRMRSTDAESPAASASLACAVSHASSGRRHPRSDAVSTASATLSGARSPERNNALAPIRRDSGSSIFFNTSLRTAPPITAFTAP